MNFPAVDYLVVLNDVVVRMLGRGQAGMIGEDAQPIADL
jgi:hypothetical protein